MNTNPTNIPSEASLIRRPLVAVECDGWGHIYRVNDAPLHNKVSAAQAFHAHLESGGRFVQFERRGRVYLWAPPGDLAFELSRPIK